MVRSPIRRTLIVCYPHDLESRDLIRCFAPYQPLLHGLRAIVVVDTSGWSNLPVIPVGFQEPLAATVLGSFGLGRNTHSRLAICTLD